MESTELCSNGVISGVGGCLQYEDLVKKKNSFPQEVSSCLYALSIWFQDRRAGVSPVLAERAQSLHLEESAEAFQIRWMAAHGSVSVGCSIGEVAMT